ncbi:hypothetical protein [Aquimarina agarilytica]|uniref:hypothetical protein n=1 Tax=Aquimarina agarilytica TaxID=1087449 RepID=UPI000289E117|nr:hypothetical protein [Aquimarina agarilytica]
MKKEDWIKIGALVGVATAVGIVGHIWLKKQRESEAVAAAAIASELKPIVKTQKQHKEKGADLEDSKPKRSLFPIKLGDQGDHITQVQAHLLKHHGWEKVKMGTYDTATQNRVKRFWKVDQITEEVYKEWIKKKVKLK